MRVYYGNYEPDSSLIDANAYWKAEERKPDVRDQAFTNYFFFWQKFAYLDWKQVRNAQEIGEIMTAVLSDLHGRESASAFDIALFRWYCAPDNQEVKESIYNLLEEGIKKELRKKWEKENP